MLKPKKVETNKFKKWLKENEIYFKTLPAVLVGFASICVGVASWIVANRTLELNKEQLALNAITQEPYFNVEITNDLSIFNNGIEFQRNSELVSVFVAIRRYREIQYVPIKDYIPLIFSSGKKVGLIHTYDISKIRLRFNDIFYNDRNDFSKIGVSNFHNRIDINLVILTKIKYINKLGKQNEVFFYNENKIEHKKYEDMHKLSAAPIGFYISNEGYEEFILKFEKHLFFKNNCKTIGLPDSLTWNCPPNKYGL